MAIRNGTEKWRNAENKAAIKAREEKLIADGWKTTSELPQIAADTFQLTVSGASVGSVMYPILGKILQDHSEEDKEYESKNIVKFLKKYT